ncbi:MAG TPA: 3-dehydroquinate synthase II [Thermoplasmata archaeon]|nr:3-dehydroquinate synthase II [Thermoplasmata archaeon]
MDRVVWVGALPRKEKGDVRSVVSAALEAGFDQIVLARPEPSLRKLGRFAPILLKDDRFFFDDVEIGRLATIRAPKDEEGVRALRGVTKHVVVRTEDWKVIPLENLIAHFQGSGTRLLVEVTDAAEAKLVFETMEVGVDGILLASSSSKEIRALRALLESLRRDVPLIRAQVTAIRALGLGDRVCVDTCSLLRSGEGLLVGNSSAGLFLVHAETVESGYVAARPFRVNAGPVHAYVYLPGGATKYLSELRAGDEVLAVDSSGRARSVIVGRLKVERRPLLLVEAEAEGLRFSTIVQNAETIRFVTPDGGAVSVSELREGDLVLLRLEEGGRHFGMRIHETIEER